MLSQGRVPEGGAELADLLWCQDGRLATATRTALSEELRDGVVYEFRLVVKEMSADARALPAAHETPRPRHPSIDGMIATSVDWSLVSGFLHTEIAITR